ncbi:MAG: hypothetical protein D6701_04565, partial [Gemmatimonadetes bacterium]
MLASTVVHVVAFGMAWWVSTHRPEVPEFVVYEMDLVSPPAVEQGEPEPAPAPELVVERPEPEPPPEPKEETPPVIEEPEPRREEP